MESTFLWVLCKYIQAALIKNEWGRRCSDCCANSEQRKKYISLTEMYCLVSYLTIMFGILTIFSTLLIDDNNIAHLCCFFLFLWWCKVAFTVQCTLSVYSCSNLFFGSTPNCFNVALSTWFDLIFNRYFYYLKMGNWLCFCGSSGTSKLAFCGSIWIYCCGDVLNRSFPRSMYFSKRLLFHF